jgi:F5/8 type C domain-containing protein
MNRPHISRMRKRLMSEQVSSCAGRPGEIDVASLATFRYSSEDPVHPLDHLIDGCCGRGGTRWASARANTTECIELEFEPAQEISRLIYEVEECRLERTQQVRVEVSADRGRIYRQILAQDYNFSPEGATFQHEEVHLEVRPVTHLRLTIVPNKGGSGVATLTSLQLFASPF